MYDVTGDDLHFSFGAKFSARDRDSDTWTGHCPGDFAEKSGWWFKSCSYCNLNANYITVNYENARDNRNYPTGIFWLGWRGMYYSLMQTSMMIRPK